MRKLLNKVLVCFMAMFMTFGMFSTPAIYAEEIVPTETPAVEVTPEVTEVAEETAEAEEEVVVTATPTPVVVVEATPTVTPATENTTSPTPTETALATDGTVEVGDGEVADLNALYELADAIGNFEVASSTLNVYDIRMSNGEVLSDADQANYDAWLEVYNNYQPQALAFIEAYEATDFTTTTEDHDYLDVVYRTAYSTLMSQISLMAIRPNPDVNNGAQIGTVAGAPVYNFNSQEAAYIDASEMGTPYAGAYVKSVTADSPADDAADYAPGFIHKGTIVIGNALIYADGSFADLVTEVNCVHGEIGAREPFTWYLHTGTNAPDGSGYYTARAHLEKNGQVVDLSAIPEVRGVTNESYSNYDTEIIVPTNAKYIYVTEGNPVIGTLSGDGGSVTGIYSGTGGTNQGLLWLPNDTQYVEWTLGAFRNGAGNCDGSLHGIDFVTLNDPTILVGIKNVTGVVTHASINIKGEEFDGRNDISVTSTTNTANEDTGKYVETKPVTVEWSCQDGYELGSLEIDNVEQKDADLTVGFSGQVNFADKYDHKVIAVCQVVADKVEKDIVSINTVDAENGDAVYKDDEIAYEITAIPSSVNTSKIVITDVLDEKVEFVSASDGGTYDATTRTVTWELTPEYVDVPSPVGDSITSTMKVGVAKTVTLNVKVTTDEANAEIINKAHDTEYDNQNKIIYEEDTNEIDLYTPDLEVIKSSNPVAGTIVTHDDEIEYSITLTNKSTHDVTINYTQLRDVMPEGTTYVANSVSAGGVYVEEGDYVEWVITDLAQNDTVTISFKVTVDYDYKGAEVKNVALYEPSHENPGTPGTITTVPTKPSNEVVHPMTMPIMKIAKTNNPVNGSIVNLGDKIEYTLTITNTGNEDARFFLVRDEIPTGTKYVEGSAVVSTGEPIVFVQNGNYIETVLHDVKTVEQGVTYTIKFTVEVTKKRPEVTEIKNVATFLKETHEDPGEPGKVTTKTDTPSNEVVNPLGKAEISVVKDATPAPNSLIAKGDELTYYLTIKNYGTAPAEFVTIRDYIPDGTTYVANSRVNATNCTSAYDSEKNYLEWVLTDMQPGEVRVVSFKVTVKMDTKLKTIENYALFDLTDTDPGKPGTITTKPTEKSNTVIHYLDATLWRSKVNTGVNNPLVYVGGALLVLLIALGGYAVYDKRRNKLKTHK